MFASHSYAGTSALINLLLLMGVRVDEIARRFGKPFPLDRFRELRKYEKGGDGDMPARVLQNHFSFRRGVRCYSFSHRLPNPDLVANRPGLFLIRDPRVSLTTWLKPTEEQVKTGYFSRFVARHAEEWCAFIDGIEKIPDRHVIRFEDWKTDPFTVVDILTKRFGLEVRKSEIEEAIYYSGSTISHKFRHTVQSITNGVAESSPKIEMPTQAVLESLQNDYSLIERICGERMSRYGYSL
jgi:hypothetical protein